MHAITLSMSTLTLSQGPLNYVCCSICRIFKYALEVSCTETTRRELWLHCRKMIEWRPFIPSWYRSLWSPLSTLPHIISITSFDGINFCNWYASFTTFLIARFSSASIPLFFIQRNTSLCLAVNFMTSSTCSEKKSTELHNSATHYDWYLSHRRLCSSFKLFLVHTGAFCPYIQYVLQLDSLSKLLCVLDKYTSIFWLYNHHCYSATSVYYYSSY